MKQNSGYIMVTITTIIKLHLLLFLVVITGCRSVNSDTDRDFTITVRQFNFKPDLLAMVENTKNTFFKKYNAQPKVIILEFNKDNTFYVESRSSLYSDNTDKLILNYNFLAGTYTDETIILIKNTNNIELIYKYIITKNDTTTYKLDYNYNVNFCYTIYSLNDFTIIESYCLDDLVQE